MDTPTIHTINAMSQEDRDALNRKMMRRFATHVAGMLFIKIAVRNVAVVLAKKAIIEAAKRA
jgi:hypothetical protein